MNFSNMLGILFLNLNQSINIIEVWDKEQYEESVANSLKDFGSLTEEVMGNNVANDIP